MTRLGEMLVSQGILTSDQLDRALSAQREEGGFLGSVLCRLHFLTEDDLVQFLKRQTGISTVDLETIRFTPELARLVPDTLARTHHCVPVQLTGDVLHVAMGDVSDVEAQEALAFRTGKTVKALLAAPSAIERAWVGLYGRPARRNGAPTPATQTLYVDQILSGVIDDVRGTDAKAESIDSCHLALDESVAPVIKLVNGILVKAIEARASDIHIEPFESEIRIRNRVDGSLRNVLSLPTNVKTSLVARIKVMAGLDISEHRFPQDGRIKVKLEDGAQVDLRISILPSQFGEKVVIRILGQGAIKDKIEDLGFSPAALDRVRHALESPCGMILTTGPTGSGKTTTLYTFLRHLNSEDRNLVTAEDPVEYQLGGITQVAVRPTIGYTFDLALRAFLRQDPDVIMVGEMRDYETASVAVKAALTGHLVLSTLHTNDAPSTVVRLIDMGIEPYLVASAVKIVLAQRLIRRVCSWCREEVPLSDADRCRIEESDLESIEHTFHGKGCLDCGQTGYLGRVPVYETMPIRSREMKRVVTEASTEIQVAQVARREGVASLREESLRLVNEGQTSIEEALRILLAE